jgi:hypothetical protein
MYRGNRETFPAFAAALRYDARAHGGGHALKETVRPAALFLVGIVGLTHAGSIADSSPLINTFFALRHY